MTIDRRTLLAGGLPQRPHHGSPNPLPFANVRTEITIFNDGAHGGSANAGPLYGARFTHWNITVVNGRAGQPAPGAEADARQNLIRLTRHFGEMVPSRGKDQAISPKWRGQ